MSNTHPESKKVRAWREKHGLTVAQLSELTGYSPKSLYWFERGTTPPRPEYKKIPPWVWHRFKMACAGAEAKMKTNTEFNW